MVWIDTQDSSNETLYWVPGYFPQEAWWWSELATFLFYYFSCLRFLFIYNYSWILRFPLLFINLSFYRYTCINQLHQKCNYTPMLRRVNFFFEDNSPGFPVSFTKTPWSFSRNFQKTLFHWPTGIFINILDRGLRISSKKAIDIF